MDPNIWGPGAWLYLHSITINYPNNPTELQKKLYKNFFINFSNTIPCVYCKHNFNIHLKKYPIDNFLNNKKNLVKWLFNIHNLTNLHLKKPIFSYKQFINKYKQIYQKKNINIYSTSYHSYFYYYILIIIFFIIIILSIIIYLYYTNNIKYSISFP